MIPKFLFALGAMTLSFAATAQTYAIKNPLVVADSLEKSLMRGDARFFDALLDKTQLAQKVAVIDKTDPARAASFSKGMFDKLLLPDATTKTSTLAARFVSQLSVASNNFQLVKSRTRDGQPSLLYRALDANGGVSYTEFVLAEKNNALSITDVYLYSVGSYMSENYRNSIGEGYVELYAKTMDNPIIKQLKVVKTIRRLENERRYEDAFRMTRILKTDKGTYWDKFFKIKRILLAQKVYENDATEYLKVLNDLQRNYPSDPATLLYAIDFYTIKKQYQNAFKSIDALQTATEDPFLNYLKANNMVLQNNTEKAKEHLNACMTALPKYDKAYFLLNDILIQRKETAELPALWNLMLQKLSFDKASLVQTLGQVADIAALKEFQDWKAK
jgi:hypothetical protein